MERETTSTDLHAWESYQRMRHLLTARIARELTTSAGLSEADFEILAALAIESEPVRPTALGCDLAWEKSRLSHQLRRMQQRGLISRDACIEDGRGHVVAITDEGRATYAKAKEAYDSAVCRYVTGVLSTEQLTQLHAITETVLPHLEPQHAGS